MNKNILTLALASSLSIGVANAAPIMIDNFNGDSYTSSAGLGSPIVNDSAGISSGGYTRLVNATTSNDFTTIGINAGANLGLFAHSQDAGITGFSQIDFDLGGMDLTVGANAFRISLDSIDLNGFFGVSIGTDIVSLSSTAVLVDNGLVTPSFADILFSDFVISDLTNVTTVSLFIDGSATTALDATIDSFGTTCSGLATSGGSGVNGSVGNCAVVPPVGNVPEPTSLALLGMGLVAFGLGRRKKSA